MRNHKQLSTEGTSSASEDVKSFDIDPEIKPWGNPVHNWPLFRGVGRNGAPLGTRSPLSSPFPPETGKRTLETGPRYER